MKEIKFEDELLDGRYQRLKSDQPLGDYSIKGFNRLVGGIHPGWVIVLGGDPATGKTTLLSSLVDGAASDGFICIFNSLEVTATQLLKKSLARLSKGSMSVAKIQKLSESAQVKTLIDKYRNTIAPNLVIIDRPISAIELGAIIGKIKRERNQQVILFQDYLQIMPSSRWLTSERLAVEESIAGLHHIATAHDVPVIAVSSISRSNYDTSSPKLAALGGSARVEYSAEIVLHLGVDGASPDERAKNAIEEKKPLVLTCLKNRFGNQGRALLTFDAAHAAFKDRKNGN